MTSNPTEEQIALRRFLSAACVQLGFCLARSIADDLIANFSGSSTDFVDRVMLAEGLSPLENKDHRRSLLVLIRRFLG